MGREQLILGISIYPITPVPDTLSRDSSESGITASDKGIAFVSKIRSYFGAAQNRLEHAYNIDKNTAENTQNAESRIRDLDYAEEIVEHAKTGILEESIMAMIAQANQSKEGIMTLLK